MCMYVCMYMFSEKITLRGNKYYLPFFTLARINKIETNNMCITNHSNNFTRFSLYQLHGVY